jgi:hypothetical protein
MWREIKRLKNRPSPVFADQGTELVSQRTGFSTRTRVRIAVCRSENAAMKKDIERGDYLKLKLVEVFADHPDFKTETGRWGLVGLAFGGISGGERATGNLNLAGHSHNAAVALVERLLDFGRLGDR